jgi:hypothetical protein
VKRVLCLLLALVLIIPVLLLSGSASEIYVFDRIPRDIMFYDVDHDFLQVDGLFCCAGPVPAGTYSVSFSGYDGDAYFLSPITVFFDDVVDIEGQSLPGVFVDCTLVIGDLHYVGQVVCVYLESEDMTAFAALPDSPLYEALEYADSASFVPVTLSVVPHLADFISVDSISGVFDNLVSLLPACIGVLVIYISIRKGISWIRSRIYGT